MGGIFRSLVDHFREDRGIPVSLVKALAEHTDIRMTIKHPRRVVALDRVPQWHRWHSGEKLGALQYWGWTGHRYATRVVQHRALAEIVQCTKVANWTCDIQDVEGLSASKSDIESFDNLDAMVETNSREMIDEISVAKLNRNLAHHEIRILRKVNKSDRFQRHQWDGRVFLCNSGGSHHFAAARYIARRIGQRVPLDGPLDSYWLEATAIGELLCEFDLYAICDDAVPYMAFHDAMERVRASYGLYHLPRPFLGQLIALPRGELRSRRVSEVLNRAGFFDVGCYLKDLAQKPMAPL